MTRTRNVSLEFTADQYRQIKTMSDFHGVTVPTYLRTAILAQTADDADYRDAMSNLKLSHGETAFRLQIRQRLGLINRRPNSSNIKVV
ncbi:DUF6290 family protein [Levilactobacillus zymae]